MQPRFHPQWSQYLEEALGYECSGGELIPGPLGYNASLFFASRLSHPRHALPEDINELDNYQLLDFIELLHDLVSVGLDSSRFWHRPGKCPGRAREYVPGPAQDFLRSQLSPMLARLEPPLRMTEDGELCLLIEGPSLSALVDRRLPAASGPVTERSEAARTAFLRPKASRADRRAAVRALADIPEEMRPRIREEMLRNDERDLFHLANRFAIRHNDQLRQPDYDDLIWLTWMVYRYLATIHAVSRLPQRAPELDASATYAQP